MGEKTEDVAGVATAADAGARRETLLRLFGDESGEVRARSLGDAAEVFIAGTNTVHAASEPGIGRSAILMLLMASAAGVVAPVERLSHRELSVPGDGGGVPDDEPLGRFSTVATGSVASVDAIDEVAGEGFSVVVVVSSVDDEDDEAAPPVFLACAIASRSDELDGRRSPLEARTGADTPATVVLADANDGPALVCELF